MSKTRVGVIFGGKSAEHEISLVSAKNIIDAIDKEKYDIELIGIDKTGKWYHADQTNFLLNDQNPKLIKLNKQNASTISLSPESETAKLISQMNKPAPTNIDVALPVLHGPLGEDGCIQGLLKIMNIPFVGCDVLGSAVCMDKDIMKRLLFSDNLPSCQYHTSYSYNDLDDEVAFLEKNFNFPVFIKPANMGSSIGISKAKNSKELKVGLEKAFQYDEKVIVETEVIGREIEVAVLGDLNPKASIPGEIVPKGDFYSFGAKYIESDGADLVIPAKLTPDEITTVQNLAIKAFRTMNCSGMARVDFFYTKEGHWFINELNTIPGFTQISQYPQLWKESGLAYSDLIDELIQLALKRHRRLGKLSSTNID